MKRVKKMRSIKLTLHVAGTLREEAILAKVKKMLADDIFDCNVEIMTHYATLYDCFIGQG